MVRRLVGVFIGMSLVLGLLTSIFCITVDVSGPPLHVIFFADRGCWGIYVTHISSAAWRASSGFQLTLGPTVWLPRFEAPLTSAILYGASYHVAIPFWMHFVGVAILMNCVNIIRRFFGAPSYVRCSACDYDLRFNTSGYCPECGKTLDSEYATKLPSDSRSNSSRKDFASLGARMPDYLDLIFRRWIMVFLAGAFILMFLLVHSIAGSLQCECITGKRVCYFGNNSEDLSFEALTLEFDIRAKSYIMRGVHELGLYEYSKGTVSVNAKNRLVLAPKITGPYIAGFGRVPLVPILVGNCHLLITSNGYERLNSNEDGSVMNELVDDVFFFWSSKVFDNRATDLSLDKDLLIGLGA